MSFERRISSLPLYTRNLHIFGASRHRLASEVTYQNVKQSSTVVVEEEEEGQCSSYTI